ARLSVVGGTNLVDGRMEVGDSSDDGWWYEAISTGMVSVTSGRLVVTNSAGNALLNALVGSVAVDGGAMLVDRLVRTNGEWSFSLPIGPAYATLSFDAGDIRLGSSKITRNVQPSDAVRVGASGKRAVLLLAGGGTNEISSDLLVGCGPGATGEVILAAGRWTGGTVIVGSNGVGRATTSNGVWTSTTVSVGAGTGARGTLAIVAGTNDFSGALKVGLGTGATGSVVVTGGTLSLADEWSSRGETNLVGAGGVGEITVSNGTVRIGNLLLADGAQGRGTLTLVGGNTTISSLVATNTRATVALNGGSLSITNGSEIANGVALVVGAAGNEASLALRGTNRFGNGLLVGNTANSTGTVCLAGGWLITTNGSCSAGISGYGEITVSNGIWLAREVTLGRNAGSSGALTLLGGTNAFGSALELGTAADSLGSLQLKGGLLVTTSAVTTLGNAGRGDMTVSNGTWLGSSVYLGFNGGGHGTLTVAGGTNQISSFFNAGYAAGSTGVVLLTGGRLLMSNETVWIGGSSVGSICVSNGTWLADDLHVGFNSGARGSVTLVGGTNQVFSTFVAGENAGATGTVLLTGGTLVATNGTTTFGASGRGQMTVSGGTWRASSVLLGQNSGSTGTLSVAGGIVLVTNSSGSAVLELRRGSLGLNGGTMTLDLLLATNAAGIVDFNGGTLASRSIVVSNGVAFAVGGGSSVAQLSLLGGTLAFQNGMAVSPNAAVSAWGNLVGALANTGAVVAAGGELRLLGAVQGPGSWRVASGDTLSFVRGGMVAGFASTGATVRVEGSLTNTGAISNPNGLILVGPDGSNSLLNVTGGSVDGGTIVVRSSGTMKVGATVDTMSSFVTNQGAFQPLADFFTLAGGFRNEAAFTSRNAQVIQVLNGFGNSGGVVLDTNSMLRVNGFGGQPQSGQITLRSGSILQSLALWTNSGTVTLAQGGMIAGGSVQNRSVIEGAGYVSAAVGNRSGGTVRATNGTLTLGGIVTNFAGGTLAATPNAELAINHDLVNQGTVNPQGGSINLPYLTLTNSGTLSGFGTFRAGDIINGGLASFSGGLADIEAVYNNLGGKTTRVTSASARFFGAVSNQAGGVFKNTSGNFTFYDTFYNAGLYASDPATNVFSGDVVIGESGAISGGEGDVFQLGGDLTVLNSNGLDIALATLQFGGGAHTLDLVGTPVIGNLTLDGSASMTLLGADLYVGVLGASASQIWSPQTIYYNETLNPQLSGQFFDLSGGGVLAPVPEPGVVALLLGSTLLLGFLRPRQRKG
ncbi:MAG: beta strand repeat-containing protein, partial [Verrucomicrobiia bacterium]